MSISRFFSVEHLGDVAVLTPNVRQTDLREINDFQNELLDFVEHYKPAKLVVDLSVVARTSSWFLGVLLRLERRVAAHHGVMRLCGMNPVVREVFHITALDRKKFQIVCTIDDAIAEFATPQIRPQPAHRLTLTSTRKYRDGWTVGWTDEPAFVRV